jgi:hypothetical protein
MSYGFVCVPKNLKHVLRGSKRGANLDDAQESSRVGVSRGFVGVVGVNLVGKPRLAARVAAARQHAVSRDLLLCESIRAIRTPHA